MSGPSDPPATPKPAATVVLARDARTDASTPDGIEVFLVRRHGKIRFMGGMHVFPGGAASDEDWSEHLWSRVGDVDDTRLVEPWGRGVDRTQAIGLALTAVRETFEEAGVLVGATLDAAHGASLRDRLLEGEDFGRLLIEAGVTLELQALTPVSRWVTPAPEPKRFDTFFFLARAPEGQHAVHDDRETVASLWVSPTGALEKRDAGELRLAPPTARTLEALRDVANVEEARARVSARRPPFIEPIIRIEGEDVLVLYPGDPDHPEAERVFPGPTRHVLRRR